MSLKKSKIPALPAGRQMSNRGLPRTNALATQMRSIWEQGSSVRGQSLFEVVFALAIAALVLVAAVSLSTSSVRNALFARNQSYAAKYAQEATEWFRQQRDTNWDSFYAKATGDMCMPTLAWGTIPPCTNPITGTIFYRQATLIAGIDLVDASVIVSWTDSNGIHEVRNATRYTYWRR